MFTSCLERLGYVCQTRVLYQGKGKQIIVDVVIDHIVISSAVSLSWSRSEQKLLAAVKVSE